MLIAWKQAGSRLSRRPRLELRWTRVCFCGQDTPAGPLADHAVFGVSYLTGSEEGRGLLFDVTGDVYEGRRLAAPLGPQGVKIEARVDSDRTLEPTAVPLTAARIGDRLVVTVPGEATTELGRRTRAAVRAATRGAGIGRVVLAGYANEYASYFTTPEEYGAQHYEGGTTVYGPASGPFLTASLAELASRLANGGAAPVAYPFDPTLGLRPTAGPYPAGAARGRLVAQPGATARLGHAVFRWRGGESGTDRPLDRPFVSVQRRAGRRWRTADDDLGLRILWRVDDARPKVRGIPRFRAGRSGTYRAAWEPPPSAPLGRYRFVITARRYRLVSRAFRLRRLATLETAIERTRRSAVVRLRYPAAARERDFTARPPLTGAATLRVGGRQVTVAIRAGVGSVRAPRSARVRLLAARDRFGNRGRQPTLPSDFRK
jgi:neutral ceramidase